LAGCQEARVSSPNYLLSFSGDDLKKLEQFQLPLTLERKSVSLNMADKISAGFNLFTGKARALIWFGRFPFLCFKALWIQP
jgi:hypothetical protein